MHPIRPARSIYATAVIVLSTILAMSISACSSESDLTNIAGEYSYTGTPIPITVSVAGIETFGSGPVTRSGAMKDTNVEPLDDDNNLVSSIESEAEQPQPLTRTALGNGIYFRVLVYMNNAVSTDNFAGAADYKINGSGGMAALVNPDSPLILKPGKYTFICYSYNKTEPIADGFDGTASTAISVSHGMDFLSAKIEATVKPDANGAYSLPGITFSHMCARVYLEMTSYEGNISECSAMLSNLNSASVQWQVGDAVVPNSAQGGTADLSWSSLNAETVKSEAIYILPNAARDVTVSLTVQAGEKKYTEAKVKLQNRAFSGGISYKIIAQTKKNYVTIPGVSYKIAAGNVVKKNNQYQMQATQGDYSGVWDGGDYFNWGAADPLNISISNTSYRDDACKKLGSQWRTPSQDEAANIFKCSVKGFGSYSGATVGGKAGTVVQGYYFGIKPAAITATPANQDEYLFLGCTGRRKSASKSVTLTTSGYFWTTGWDGRVGYYIRIQTSEQTAKINSYASPNYGAAVRCIRN